MKCKAGLSWDSELPFNRYLEDSGVTCELITPQILAAPFYHANMVSMIVPTGFGNRMYSNLLPALRASSDRIRKYLEKGGRILVFGAMTPAENCYDWLPFEVNYVHEYFSASVKLDPESPYSSIMDDYDTTAIECDGYFRDSEGESLAVTEDGRTIMIGQEIGKGQVIITSMHEYPSRGFLKTFCSGEMETLF